MNPIFRSVIILSVFSFACVWAQAQQAGPSNGVSTATTVKSKDKKGAKKDKLDKLDANLKDAYRVIGGAEAMLNHALPIYDGHRLLAVDLIKAARSQILASGDQSAVKVKKKAKKGIKDEGHDHSKFPPRTLAQSQKAMVMANVQLNRALEDLKKAPASDYVTQASENLQSAKAEIELGIALHKTNP